MFRRSRDFLAARAYVLFTVIVLASVLGIGFTILTLDRDKHLSAVRHDLEQALFEATDQIRLRFFEAVLVANNIERLLDSSDEVPERQIARVVADLQKHNPGVLALALAPGLKITHSFPQTSNRSTIGLKYWEVPDQMPSVARAYRTRSPVVDGPVNLVQGGAGYILRYPVFVEEADLGVEHFWGILSIVVKSDGLFTAQAHDFGDSESFNFTLRELKAPGAAIEDSAPGTARPRNGPVTTEFTMLNSTWQASAWPSGGWPSYSPQSPYLLAFALLSALILVGVLWAFRSLAVKKANAHALLAEAIDCIDEGFVAFDDRERLVIVNQKYRDYHPEFADLIVPGKTMEELVRLGVMRGQYPAAEGRQEDWIAERLARFRRPGGSFLQDVGGDRWLKVTEAKTPHGYTVGIRTDVTAEKTAQEAAEAADREKTEFLNNVSHELRTPLTVISGRASFLRNAERLPQSRRIEGVLAEAPTEEADLREAIGAYQHFVADQGAGIADSAQHMLRLVEDLLDWTKVARGQLELDMDQVEVGGIAASVVEDLRPDAEAKGLALTFASDGPVETQADRIRLKQILYNLTSNAIKFTDRGSIHLAMRIEEEAIRFSVTDTGCGISEENLERVFQRFQQVDGSMSRQNGGLGLGLAIAEQLAALHGGTLSLESRLGEGSTFRLCLPRRSAPVALKKSA